MQIFLLAKGARVETKEEAIAPPTRTVDDPSLSFGATAERQEGSPGKKLVTYLVTEKDGKVSRKQIQAAVIDPPVPKIIAKGTTVNVPSARKAAMAAAGISSSDYGYVNYIVSRESGWSTTASGLPPGGPYKGAYGLCQSNPGSKMASAGKDWLNNPVTQLRWCSSYAKGRYGSWSAAYNHWSTYHSW